MIPKILTLRRTTLLGDFIISVILGSGLSPPDEDAEGGLCSAAEGTGGVKVGGPINSFSWIILPPLLEVFSTCNATDMPCSFFPRP